MNRFVIVLCDALRPDHVATPLMPNLARFRNRNTWFSNHRSVFPSDTRANAASFVTGAAVTVHGIIGNAFALGCGDKRRIVNTGDHDAVQAEHARSDGHFITATTLADHLLHAGKTLAIISSASTGTTKLLGLTTGISSPFTLSCHHRVLSTPGPLHAAIENDLGPPPPEASPDLAALDYGISAFVRHIWPSMLPDCAVLWFNEPDVSYHDRGPTGANNVLRSLDTALGALIDWWEAEGQEQGVTLFMASDHGQRMVSHPVDVYRALREYGLKVGNVGEAGVDFELITGGFGQIYARNGASIGAAVDVLQQIDAVELLLSPLTNLPDGVLPAAAAMVDHERCPDLIFTFGGTAYSQGAANLGMHGGARADEMTAFLAGGGPLLASEHVISHPTCTTDLLPTILSGLRIAVPPSCHGRPITASMTETWSTDWSETHDKNQRRILRRFRNGARAIVDQSFVEPRQQAEAPR